MRKLIFFSAALLLCACTSKPEPLDWNPSGSGPIETGAGGNGGSAPIGCATDADCGRDQGLRCDREAGVCVHGEECDADYSCRFGENGGYCDEEENPCVCVADATSQHGGVCWLRLGICERCETAADCGSSDLWDDPRGCVTFAVDGAEPAKVCLPMKGNGSCFGGTIAGAGELEGYCIPQDETCPNRTNCEGEPDFTCESNCCDDMGGDGPEPWCIDGAWTCPMGSIRADECHLHQAECPCQEQAPGDLCVEPTGRPTCAPQAEDYAACPATLCSGGCEGFDSAQVPAGCSCTCENDWWVVCSPTEG